jgi:hypothetical protein
VSGGLDDEPFEYRATKDGRVRIAFRGRMVTTLTGPAAERFLDRSRAAGAEEEAQQQLMARATGHFKHGNERRGGS